MRAEVVIVVEQREAWRDGWMGGGRDVSGLAGVLADLFVLETEIRCRVTEPFMRGGDSAGGAA